MRGNHLSDRMVGIEVRSIPACAGEPLPIGLTRRNTRVYPRVCGGTCVDITASVEDEGLSPRVRGNRSRAVRSSCSVRSIPRVRGTATLPMLVQNPQGLSPRVRGNRFRIYRKLFWEGSIPACAGDLCCRPTGPYLARSIPACAGEPVRLLTEDNARRVYPRVCGGTLQPQQAHC